MSRAVVVAGEALIDLTPRPDGALSPHVGGGPFNAALALARLERPTAFIGCVSRDAFGREIARRLTDEGVTLAENLRTDRPTTLAVAELNEAGSAAYSFHLTDTSAMQLTPSLAAEALPREIDALHVGSLALALAPTAPAINALIEAVKGLAPIMIDPNVRPAVINDLDAYRRRLSEVIARADILKVSDADLEILSPGADALDAARGLLEQGPRLVLLTLGGRGAMALGSFGAVEVPAPAVEVVDTIGAGDIFSAAWLDSWLTTRADVDDREAVETATRFAVRVAALSCASAGASPPRKADLV